MVYYCRLVKDTGVYLVEFPDGAERPLPEVGTGPHKGLHAVEVEPHILVAWDRQAPR